MRGSHTHLVGPRGSRELLLPVMLELGRRPALDSNGLMRATDEGHTGIYIDGRRLN